MKVRIRRVDSYNLDEIQAAVTEFFSIRRINRIENARRILLKPNLLGAYLPEKAVTTHPVVLEAVIRYLLDRDIEVWIGDSPGGSISLDTVWEKCGLKSLADKYPVQLVNFSKFGLRELEYDDLSLKVSNVAWEVDTIISLSKCKTHSLVGFTGAIKNLFGLVPGLIKSEYHKQYPTTEAFCHMIAGLHRVVKHRVGYHIMDAVLGMDGAGPSAGKVRKLGLLLGSTSAPSIDCIASRFMGFRVQQVPYLFETLHQEGILPSRIDIPTSFKDFRWNNINISSVNLRTNAMRYIPPYMADVFRRLYEYYPVITSRCKRCGVCVRSCPVQAISDYTSDQPAIDKSKCIRCMCCHELCPFQAVELYKSPLAKLIIR